MKVLVVVGSHSGWSRQLADHAGQALRDDGHEVELVDVDDAAGPGDAGAVLVLGGVRAGKWHGGVRDWVQAHADDLRDRPLGLATVCLSAADVGGKGEADAHAVVDPLLDATGLDPVRVELTGGYDPSRVNLAERMIMKALKQQPTDLVDPVAAAEFARRVVGQ